MRTLPLLLAACGFPDPHVTDATVMDATVDDAASIDGGTSDGGSDVGSDVAIVTGCKSSMDCAMTCTGKTPSPCGCQAYLADGAVPNCDSSCQLTGCLNKTAICTDAGTCIIQ